MGSCLGKVVVTGASGFIGRALCRRILDRGGGVVAIGRRALAPSLLLDRKAEQLQVGDIGPDTDWSGVLGGADVVIHLAARVHVMRDSVTDPLAEFRRTNTEGTEHLARCVAESGASRLVYVSSIKVNGESTHEGFRFTPVDAPAPQDPYGISKWEAEQALHRVAAETGLEVVIVRPPLVYGPDVKGNFAQMLGIIAKGAPLPFASVHNRRSLVYVENLVDALIMCASHPAAAGQTYLVRDGEDISTPDLLRRLAAEMGKPARLFPFPPHLLQWAGKLIGRSQQIDRLLGSLQVDDGKIREELGWSPPHALQQGLRATAKWYKNKHT